MTGSSSQQVAVMRERNWLGKERKIKSIAELAVLVDGYHGKL